MLFSCSDLRFKAFNVLLSLFRSRSKLSTLESISHAPNALQSLVLGFYFGIQPAELGFLVLDLRFKAGRCGACHSQRLLSLPAFLVGGGDGSLRGDIVRLSELRQLPSPYLLLRQLDTHMHA